MSDGEGLGFKTLRPKLMLFSRISANYIRTSRRRRSPLLFRAADGGTARSTGSWPGCQRQRYAYLRAHIREAQNFRYGSTTEEHYRRDHEPDIED